MATKSNEADELQLRQNGLGDQPVGHLPPCDKPHVAETARNEEEDGACDDGIR